MRLLPILAALLAGGLHHARAAPSPPPAAGPERCEPAIASAEQRNSLPPRLLGSIALVESGRPDPATGRPTPWPWTIDVGGVDHVYASKAEAVAAVQDLRAMGVRSIDVGCLQINLMYHPDAFASMEEAFDPAANASYGARFLGALYRQTGTWPRAAAAYHSQTPDLGQAYETRVMALWPLAGRFPDRAGDAARPRPAAADYSHYTQAFASSLRQAAADRARLDAQFGARVDQPPARPPHRAAPRPPAARREAGGPPRTGFAGG